MNGDPLCCLKDLEKENERLRRAVSDLALDQQILQEAARGNFRAPRVAAHGSILSVVGSRSRNSGPGGCWVSIARPNAGFRAPVPTRSAGLRTGSGGLAGRSATATAASRPGCATPAGGSTTRGSSTGGGARGGRYLPNPGNGADGGSVPDRGRPVLPHAQRAGRVPPREPGHPGLAHALFERGRRRAERSVPPAGRAGPHPFRPRSGVRRQGRAAMDLCGRCPHGLHPAGIPPGERIHRRLPRTAAGRAPKRGDLPYPEGGPDSHRIPAPPRPRRASARQLGIPTPSPGNDPASLAEKPPMHEHSHWTSRWGQATAIASKRKTTARGVQQGAQLGDSVAGRDPHRGCRVAPGRLPFVRNGSVARRPVLAITQQDFPTLHSILPTADGGRLHRPNPAGFSGFGPSTGRRSRKTWQESGNLCPVQRSFQAPTTAWESPDYAKIRDTKDTK